MTGRYKAYSEYKESGVKFVNTLPTHWTTSKVRYISAFGRGLAITKANLQDTGIPCVSYGEVHSKFGFEIDPKKHTLKCVSEEYLASSPYALLSKGDFVFADTSEDIDGSGNFTQLVSDETLFAGYHTVIVRPASNNYYRFVAYLFDSSEFRTHVRDAVKGVKVFSVTQAILKNAGVWLPSYAEQQKIANFLDHETAKIDILITKQEKLIELLKEKRLATRYHAVTKGLNLNVSLIETGISWTPSAPEHWSLVPNRSVMSMRRVLVGQNYRNYQLLSLTKKGVLVRNISSGEGKQSDHLDRTQEVRDGDLVFCLFDVEETPRTVGLSHHIGMISGDYTIFECSNPSMARFVEYFYKAMDDRKLLKPLYRGLRKRIPKPGFLRVNIPIPPKEELENILQFLDDLEERIEQLMYLADKQVALLKERKAALISAAVTGKIDVRHFVSKQGQTPIEQ